jgi:hypothetical protein
VTRHLDSSNQEYARAMRLAPCLLLLASSACSTTPAPTSGAPTSGAPTSGAPTSGASSNEATEKHTAPAKVEVPPIPSERDASSAVDASVDAALPDNRASKRDAPLPIGRSCPQATRNWSYQEGLVAFATIKKGWSKSRVLATLGGPTSCDGATYTYVAGPYSGPEVSYRFTFSKEAVIAIKTSSVGCRYLIEATN